MQKTERTPRQLLMFILAIALVHLTAPRGLSQPVPQDNLRNWSVIMASQGYIETSGKAVAPSNAASEAHGKILARQGARMDAQRNLVETLYGIAVEAESTMVNFMANEVVRTSTSGFLQNTEIVPGSESWIDGVYRLELRMYLPDLVPAVVEANQNEFGSMPLGRPEGAAPSTNYTGLVIDARNLDFVPRLMFELMDEQGQMIFSAAEAAYEVALGEGLADFTMSLDHALQNERVGDNPLLVRAMGTYGDFNSTLVVSAADGETIRSEFAGANVFVTSRIVVVAN